MSIKISYPQAVELAQMAVAERGEDYVYHRPWFPDRGSSCAYYDAHGEPSCIVGFILHRMGIRFRPMCDRNFLAIASLIAERTVKCDLHTSVFLRRLQSVQDNGECWGQALKQALEAANLRFPQPTAELEPTELSIPAQVVIYHDGQSLTV